MQVHLDWDGDIAILKIDNPPVNAGSLAVRAGLLASLEDAINNKASGAIILGAGNCFVAGSDLREFGKPLQSPELPTVIQQIEEAPFPIVAALHGVALGGGLELALGCDYRIASPGTKLGLPEVSLGMIPGAGGTQRLPRLIGVSNSLDLICGAKRIAADRALELGLIDLIAEADLLSTALQFLRDDRHQKRHALNLTPPAESPENIANTAEKMLARGKGRPNISEAIRLVQTAGNNTGSLKDERDTFQSLRVSEDAFALRYLFFAERQSSRVDGLDMSLATTVGQVGVVGAGTMGQGIARNFLASGISVTLLERDSDTLNSAFVSIEKNLKQQCEKNRLTPEDVKGRMSLLKGSVELSQVSKCDLVIEAVFEDLEVKKAVLAELESYLDANAIIATNTSYLDIDAMVQHLANPQKVLGLHFFSPADVMRLIEIVKTNRTSDATLATGIKLARKLGKQPVISRVSEGFIGNRIYSAYRRRAELLVLDGARPEFVDKAITQFGFAMGPFAVGDMSGLDIAWAMRKRTAHNRDARQRYSPIADELCEAGYFGRKEGKGWYDYSDGKAQPYSFVNDLISRVRSDQNITPKDYSEKTIQRQLMAAILNEAALLLDENIAQYDSDIDVVLTNGYGFPRWLGGPVYWAAQQDATSIERAQQELAKSIGFGHLAGNVAKMIASLRESKEA